MIKQRLDITQHAEEVNGNVAATCRYYGISRPRFLQVEAPLRRARRGRAAGFLEQAAQQRYHDVTIRASGVWRILKGSR